MYIESRERREGAWYSVAATYTLLAQCFPLTICDLTTREAHGYLCRYVGAPAALFVYLLKLKHFHVVF